MLFRSFTSACSTILISLRSLKLSVSIQDGVLLKKTCKTSCWIAIFRMFLASILLIKNNIYANSIEKSTLRTTFLSTPLKPPYVPALHTAGKELIFFIVSGMMLCFGFWRKTMLIAHWCFRCRWAVLYRNKDTSVSCTSTKVWGTEWAQGAGRGRN